MGGPTGGGPEGPARRAVRHAARAAEARRTGSRRPTVAGLVIGGLVAAGTVGLGTAWAVQQPGPAAASAGPSGQPTSSPRKPAPTASASPSPSSVASALGYDPADTGSLSAITRITGVQDAWAQGITGAGVDVALIDTGVAPVPGLDAPGKVLTGPDLSLDAPGAPTPGLDAYGHGTFMASLIAGRDAGASASAAGCSTCLNSSGYSDTTAFVGVAPEARVVDVKVGAADGAVDVTQVIAGIDWVVQHAHDPGLNIRVINLSFGTDSDQGYGVDPLAQAAEQAWQHGIVVVAAAGNEGRPAAAPLADPGYDPYLIAVGAEDPNGTLDPADDTIASFAQHGTPLRPVDVVAPGTHVLGLRVPGSYVDSLATNTGQVGSRFQRGSGTSEATAIVSGVAALLAQRYPDATPDQLKAMIDAGAHPLPLADGQQVNPGMIDYSGHGLVDAAAALSGATDSAAVAGGAATAVPAGPSTGTGTLDASRGGVYLSDGSITLTGQQDILGHDFDSAAMAAAQADASAWSGGTWNGNRWTGAGWGPSGWLPAPWSASSDWAGTVWTGSRWGGSRWGGSRWGGMSWTGSRWGGSGWQGSRWGGCTWSTARWSTASWS